MLGIEISSTSAAPSLILFATGCIAMIVAIGCGVATLYEGRRRRNTTSAVIALAIAAAAITGAVMKQGSVNAVNAETIRALKDHYGIELIDRDVNVRVPGQVDLPAVDRTTKRTKTVTVINNGSRLYVIGPDGRELTPAD